MTQQDARPPSAVPRRPPPWTWLALGLVVAALAGLYVARNLIAREALLSWLRERGAPAQADIRGLGLGGLTGRIVVGPPDRPDFAVETSEVGYRLSLSPKGFGLQVRSLRLVRPTLRATLKGGRVSFGSLDPLIAEFRKRPPTPDTRQPQVRVEGGQVLLDGDLGRAELRADAQLDDGQLLRLDARLGAPARLTVRDVTVDLAATRLVLIKRRDRMDLDFDARLAGLTQGERALEGAHLRLTGQGPYPDLKRRRGDGAVSLRFTAQTDAAAAGAAKASMVRLDSSFTGRSTGWIDTLSVVGSATGEVEAKNLAAPAAKAQDLKLRLAARALTWTRTGGDRLALDLRGDGEAGRLATGALILRAATARAEGPASIAASGIQANFAGAVSARGAVADMAPVRTDVAQTAAVKRFLRDFTLFAPGLRVTLGSGGPGADLTAPARLRGASGGEAVVTAPGALFRNGVGAFELRAQGGGLPVLAASVQGLRFAPGGARGRLRLSAQSDFDMVRSGRLQARGAWRIADEVVRFVGEACAPFTAERLEFGDNDVTAVKGELCPAVGKPMFEYRGGNWQVRGVVRGGSATSALLQAAVSGARGGASFGMSKGALTAAAELTSAAVRDVAPELRFNPIRIAGPALLREGVWQAAIVATDPAGRRLGEALVSHDVRTGVGEANLDTGDLAFTPGGLQPAALSPLAAALASPADGHAGFSGEVTWTPQGVTSRGVLTIRQIDFVSALGPVHGLAGEIALTSLTPLAAAPEQRLRIAAIDAFTPVTGVEAVVGIAEEATQVRSVSAAVAAGKVRLENLVVPFDRAKPWGGVLQAEGVELSPIVEASPFADRIDIDAKVTGRIPFRVLAEGVRIAKGELHAIQPGRLSIRREALTGVSAAPSEPEAATEPAAAPNAFTDFAYQAMEHLAFETLSADIDSLPQGRLGVLFRIKGEHRPPKKQVLKVGVGELIDQSFMNRPQPLPSGTKVDLTLDTTLNLDQLLEDFAGYRNAYGSAGVQPAAAMKPSPTVEQSK